MVIKFECEGKTVEVRHFFSAWQLFLNTSLQVLVDGRAIVSKIGGLLNDAAEGTFTDSENRTHTVRVSAKQNIPMVGTSCWYIVQVDGETIHSEKGAPGNLFIAVLLAMLCAALLAFLAVGFARRFV